MTDREIDAILRQSSPTAHEVDPALLKRIGESLRPSLCPVRPLPPAWRLTAALTLACLAVAAAGASLLGLRGMHQLSSLQRASIFPSLGILIWLASAALVGQMIPGSRRRVAPGALLAAVCLALLALFAVLFRDYQTSHFVSQGLLCLSAGLLHAIPTALLSWLILRRGYAVNRVAAGLAAGILAGLTGVTMLELHCPNFQALHIMFWHTSVLLISGAVGAILIWAGTKSAVHNDF